VGKGSLITNERPQTLASQVKETLLPDLNERKIVKTISLKKRIALVAVAALGSSLVVSAPASNAAIAADVTAINALSVTSSPAVNASVQVNVGVTTATGGGSAITASLKGAFVGATDYPAGGWVAVSASRSVGGGSASFGSTGISTSSAAGATLSLLSAGSAGFAAATLTASATTGVGSFTFTPTKAGTYVLTIWHEASDGGTTDAVNSNEARTTVSITVGAAATTSGGTSRMVVASGTTAYGAGSVFASSDTGITGSRTIGTQRAIASVEIRDSSNAVQNGATLAASVSGPGLVLVDTSSTAAAGTARSSSATLTGASVGYVHVSGDGTSGVGTVTVTATDPNTAATTTIGTFTVTFYSTTVATLTATANYVNIGAGQTPGCASNVTCLWTTYSTGSAGLPAVSLVAKDSSGVVIPSLTGFTSTIADAAVISTTTVTAANANDAKGLGYYNVSVTGASASISGKTTTVTWTYTNSATSVITSNAITFTAAGTTIASETLEFNKTSYVAGDPMVITRTAKDAAGNPVADGTASPAVTFSKTVGGTAPAAGVYVAGKSATSATSPTVFAPVTGGAFTATMTGGDAAATVRTASSSVVDGNAALLTQIDALNAKIVALNALIAKIMKKLGVK